MYVYFEEEEALIRETYEEVRRKEQWLTVKHIFKCM
jgi:hypothetical protein